MTDWAALEGELDAWSEAGQTATLWWRDDDAVAATAALDRLIRTAAGLPLGLAVIPAGAQEGLARRLEGVATVAVLQHGYSHANNAPAPQKKCEFPAGRDLSTGLGELRRGRERLAALFGGRSRPLLVPPWNRIDPALASRLPEIGIAALSTYGRRRPSTGPRNLLMVNTHVDVIDWHGSRGFLGEEACLALMIDHLRDRRLMQTDMAETTGLLTHHLVHDEACWVFLAELARRTARHPAVRWLDARELLLNAGG